MNDIYHHSVERHVGSCQLNEKGQQLHYVIHGPIQNQNKIMLIMGLTTDGANWLHTVDHFTSKGFSVLTFDNLGNGRSSTPTSMFELSIYSMGQDALKLLEFIQWEASQTHLVGVSMGGMISLEMLARRRFRSGTLIVTTGVSALWFPMGGIWHMVRTLLDPTLTTYERSMLAMEQNFDRDWLDRDSDFVHPRTGQVMTNEKSLTRVGAKIWYGKQNDGIPPDPTTTGMLAQMLACVRHHVSQKKLNRIRTKNGPLLIIGAKNDKMVRTNASRELADQLEPSEFFIVDSSHGLIRQYYDQVHAGMERLFETSQVVVPVDRSRL